jgi:RHH-type transcriptional regulator, proline utilization regulon repressor / proline dehydrogenase / delta 1-pyrroline-5-carboxylate dehydrogenase
VSAENLANSPAFDDLPREQLAAIEVLTQSIGGEIFANLEQTQPHVWQRRWWDDRLLAWSMRDEQLKVQLFRFVDVLPMLKTPDAVMEHLHEYLDTVRDKLPQTLNVALGVARRMPFTRAAVARAARLSATDFAKRFIAGENVPQVLAAAQRERTLHRAFTLDILGEAVISEAEAERHFQAYLELLEAIGTQVQKWPADPLIDSDDRGEIPRANLSIKLSALDSQFDCIDPEGTARRVGGRLRELFRAAQRLGAFINVDMESYEKKAITLHIFQLILSEPEFREWPDVGIVLQCYLRDTERDLVLLRDWARDRRASVWVRLVKGAYWDHETIKAQANGWPIPVFQKKWQSDACFERCTRFALQNTAHLRPALGSHNIRSLAHGIAAARVLELPPAALELQMLYGMADAEKQALIERGQRLRIYMPYGDLIPGMAYLVRRLLENTSNDSFLRAGFVEHVAPQELLRNPSDNVPLCNSREQTCSRNSATDHPSLDHRDQVLSRLVNVDHDNKLLTPTMLATFTNQPPVDFSIPENRAGMQAALAAVREQFGRHCPALIAQAAAGSPERGASTNPSNKTQVVGTYALGSRADVDAAVEIARRSLDSWRAVAVEERANILRATHARVAV